jgi:hypothetical protein
MADDFDPQTWSIQGRLTGPFFPMFGLGAMTPELFSSVDETSGSGPTGSALLDDVRISNRREAFANQASTAREGIFCDFPYQVLGSYRPNQIYQDPVFFLLFQARQ